MGQPVISLHDLVGLAVVADWPSGVIYTNQAGGVFCLQPKTEGVLVPLGDDDRLEGKLDAFFANRPIRLKPADADALDAMLRSAENPLSTRTFFLEVDRGKLEESMEAWLYVTIVACPDEHMTAYGQDRDGKLSNISTLSGRAWSPEDQPELEQHADQYPLTGFGRRSAVLTWPNSD